VKSLLRGRLAWALAIVCLLTPRVPATAATAADAPLLLRLFLAEGGTLVSYGEFTRTPDLVVFAMPVGGPMTGPNVQVVSLPATSVDWLRTESDAESARYHHYVSTRGEVEYRRLTEDVARTLNLIALTTEPGQALQIASQARLAMLRWPQDHFGYRSRDIEEIVWLLDESIGALRAKRGVGAFDVALTARTAEAPPMRLPPAPLLPADILDGILAAARVSPRSAPRGAAARCRALPRRREGAAAQRGAVDEGVAAGTGDPGAAHRRPVRQVVGQAAETGHRRRSRPRR